MNLIEGEPATFSFCSWQQPPCKEAWAEAQESREPSVGKRQWPRRGELCCVQLQALGEPDPAGDITRAKLSQVPAPVNHKQQKGRS